MGYNIKEVSRELGLCEKSILRKIRDESFKDYVYMEGGTVYIKDEGISYILNNSSKEEMFIENINKIKEIEDKKDKEILYLNKEIEILKLEKEHLSDRLNFIESMLNRREDEIKRLNMKVKEMNSLESRYNDLYSKVSDVIRDKNGQNPQKNSTKKGWLKF